MYQQIEAQTQNASESQSGTCLLVTKALIHAYFLKKKELEVDDSEERKFDETEAQETKT